MSVAALVVSIITAVVTGVVPAWIYKRQATSILKFNVDSDFSQESIRFKKLKGESNAVRFRKRAYMYLRNVGDAPLTIETVLIAAIDPKINNPNGVEWRQAISRVGPWRFDTQYPLLEVAFSSQDDKPVVFPLTIEPRRVVKIGLSLNVGIAREVWQKVSKKIPTCTDLAYFKVEKIFDDAGVPYFGYEVADGSSKLTLYYRYFLVRLTKEDGKDLYGVFDLLGSQGEQGE